MNLIDTIDTKDWIKARAKKITEGYKNPFTGDLMDDRIYVHFSCFAFALEVCEKYNSLDELIEDNLVKS